MPPSRTRFPLELDFIVYCCLDCCQTFSCFPFFCAIAPPFFWNGCI